MRGHIRPARSALGKQGKAWTIHFRDAAGRQRQETVRGTKREVQQVLTQRLRERDTGISVDPRHLTVSQYLEHWLNDSAKMRLARQSFIRYEKAVERLSKSIGSVPLAKLSPLQVQAVYQKMADDGRSPAYIALHHAVLHRALKQAVRWRILTFSPMDGVETPPRHTRMVRALTKEQALALLAAARDNPNGLPVILGLGLGLRAGEVFGLQWENIDLEAGRVRVCRSLENLTGQFKPPKSGKPRWVTLPEFVAIALREHAAEQARTRAQCGEEWNPDNLVVCSGKGTTLRNHLALLTRRLCEKAEIPPVTFHALRHTHATLLLDDGENIKVVSERLGHSNVSITLDVYAHVLPGMPEKTASRMDAILR